METLPSNQYWVKLVSARVPTRFVVFNTMPTIAESQAVNYSAMNPVHMPGTYNIYENTPSKTFEIGDLKLVSRNQQEARKNLERINILRAWTKPYFGSIEVPGGSKINESEASELKDYLGAPPEVVLLSAYSDEKNRGNIYKIPTILTSLSISYPNDVDYIPTSSSDSDDGLGGVPFPTLLTISVSLTEQHSANEFEKFNLAAYRTGQLLSF